MLPLSKDLNFAFFQQWHNSYGCTYEWLQSRTTLDGLQLPWHVASSQTGLPTFLASFDKRGASVSGVQTPPDLSQGPTENAAEGKLCNGTGCSELFIAGEATANYSSADVESDHREKQGKLSDACGRIFLFLLQIRAADGNWKLHFAQACFPWYWWTHIFHQSRPAGVKKDRVGRFPVR